MFSGDNSVSLECKDDDDDFVVNLCDFEFNLQLQTSLQEVERIREFSKNIIYRDDGIDRVRLWADEWFMVLDFVPFIDFFDFSLVCSLFAELLTFNRRYLVMKRILQEFPSLLKDTHLTSIESLRNLAQERSPTDDASFSESLYSDLIHFLFEKKRYKKNMWNDISNEKILTMDQQEFIRPFRPSMIRNTFFDFNDIPQIIREDKTFILKLFDSHSAAPNFYVFLNSKLKSDQDIIKRAFKRNSWFLTSDAYSPTEEIVNLAFQSNHKYTVITYHSLYQPICKKFKNSLLSEKNYKFVNERMILKDFRKSKTQTTYFSDLLRLDELHKNKHCEFLIQMAYFERSNELKNVLLHYHTAKSSYTNHSNMDHLLADMLCFPERFDYFSVPIHVHESLKCKTKQINVLQIVKRILDDNFTLNTVIQNEKMKLTKSSIEYLRERVVERGKVTHLFSKLYFDKWFENVTNCKDESEAAKFLTEISSNRKLILRMLKFHPKYFSKIDEKFKQDDDFIQISLLKLTLNGQYFDFSQDSMIVKALSSNFKRTIQFFRKQPNWESMRERIKKIFLNESGGICEKWLTWPNAFRFFKYFWSYNSFDYEIFTLEERVKMMQHISPKCRKGMCDYYSEVELLDKIGMKNLLSPYSSRTSRVSELLKYCVSYKSYFAISNSDTIVTDRQLLSDILKHTPKFIKLFFNPFKPRHYQTHRVSPIPFDVIKELALENPEIIYYLPKNIRKKLENRFAIY